MDFERHFEDSQSTGTGPATLSLPHGPFRWTTAVGGSHASPEGSGLRLPWVVSLHSHFKTRPASLYGRMRDFHDMTGLGEKPHACGVEEHREPTKRRDSPVPHRSQQRHPARGRKAASVCDPPSPTATFAPARTSPRSRSGRRSKPSTNSPITVYSVTGSSGNHLVWRCCRSVSPRTEPRAPGDAQTSPTFRSKPSSRTTLVSNERREALRCMIGARDTQAWPPRTRHQILSPHASTNMTLYQGQLHAWLPSTRGSYCRPGLAEIGNETPPVGKHPPDGTSFSP